MNKSLRQSAIMSGGTIANSILGLFFYILIARFLGPSGFGNFTFFLGFGLLAAEVGDLGLGSALVRFGSGADLRGVFTLTFAQRIVSGITFFALAFLAHFFISGNFYFPALIGISLQLLSLTTQSFLARQKFGFFVATNIVGNVTRLGLVWFFWSLSNLNVETTLWAFLGANFLAFAFGFSLLLSMMKTNPFNLAEAKKVLAPVWNFSRWVALSYGIASINAKLDVPIIYALAGSSATGVYSSAQKLTSVFIQIAASIEGVFAPKFSNDTQRKSFFKEYMLIAVAVSLALLILPLFSGFFITLIFGGKYNSAIPVFNLLSLALIPFFLSGPFAASTLYRLGKSNYHLAVSIGQMVVGIFGYFLFIPIIGVNGAAVTTLFINLTGLIAYYIIYQKLK